jgi:hypothetical protein
MKIAIVGGGASAAARARRLSEAAEIIVFERGYDPSFALVDSTRANSLRAQKLAAHRIE